MEDGEKKDQDKGKEERRSDEKKPLKKRRGPRKEQAEAFMAAFLAGLDIYQTKTLVRNVTFLYMCPCRTKAVISNTGIFVVIANNTLYGSKLSISLLCQKSLGY